MPRRRATSSPPARAEREDPPQPEGHPSAKAERVDPPSVREEPPEEQTESEAPTEDASVNVPSGEGRVKPC